MQFARTVLGRLVLSSIALAGAASMAQAQHGPPTYTNYQITNATYTDAGSVYDIDTDFDGIADRQITDPGNQFFTELMNEYTWQKFYTNIWVTDGVVVAVQQWW